MITLTAFQENQAAILRSRNPRVRILIKELTTGTVIDTDVSSFISSFGSVTRRLTFDIGNFSPGSHSFTFKNSKDLGEFFFTHGKGLGTEFWMDKQYELLFGFYDPTSVTTERIDRDFIQFYTGIIQGKTEDLRNGRTTVQSKDLTQEILDKKVCTLISAKDVFDNDDGTDDERGFQQVIKYGTHRLIQNSSDRAQVKNRNDPFTVVVTHPNTKKARRILAGAGTGTFRNAFNWFYAPTHNSVTDIYGASDPVSPKKKIYYWDYRDDQQIWVAFANADISGGSKISVHDDTLKGGIYVEIGALTFTPSNPQWPTPSNDWDDYINGTSDWDVKDSEGNKQIEKLDPAICPVRIIDDLLTSTLLTSLADSTIDKSTNDFTAIDTTFTFDSAFEFFDNDASKINVNKIKETSIFKIIQDILQDLIFLFAYFPRCPLRPNHSYH